MVIQIIMAQLFMDFTNNREEENAEEVNTPAAITDTMEPATQPEALEPEEKQVNNKVNLLYVESLRFIPGSLRGNQDPRYVYAKFPKNYKNFDYTYKDILEILEKPDLLKYLQLLQISKPNKSIDVYFRTEDAAVFFINKHIEIRGKPIPFIQKAKRVLRVMIKGVQPDLADDALRTDLFDYVEHVSSIRHVDRNYKWKTFFDGTRQVFVTYLTKHIPRSIKIGNRWCLVFNRDQPVPHRRSGQVPTIVVTPSPWKKPPPQWSQRSQGRALVPTSCLMWTQINLRCHSRHVSTSPCLRLLRLQKG